jgi:hypothetical protein
MVVVSDPPTESENTEVKFTFFYCMFSFWSSGVLGNISEHSQPNLFGRSVLYLIFERRLQEERFFEDTGSVKRESQAARRKKGQKEGEIESRFETGGPR